MVLGRCRDKACLYTHQSIRRSSELADCSTANHFYRYAPSKIDYAINRYQTETKRLYQVLNDRLAAQPSDWIVGGKFSIADLSCFSWVNWAEWAGVETKPFPALQEWLEKIQEREGVKRGLDVPEKFEMKVRLEMQEHSQRG